MLRATVHISNFFKGAPSVLFSYLYSVARDKEDRNCELVKEKEDWNLRLVTEIHKRRYDQPFGSSFRGLIPLKKSDALLPPKGYLLLQSATSKKEKEVDGGLGKKKKRRTAVRLEREIWAVLLSSLAGPSLSSTSLLGACREDSFPSTSRISIEKDRKGNTAGVGDGKEDPPFGHRKEKSRMVEEL